LYTLPSFYHGSQLDGSEASFLESTLLLGNFYHLTSIQKPLSLSESTVEMLHYYVILGLGRCSITLFGNVLSLYTLCETGSPGYLFAKDFPQQGDRLTFLSTGNLSPTSQTSPNVLGMGFLKSFSGVQKKVTRGENLSPLPKDSVDIHQMDSLRSGEAQNPTVSPHKPGGRSLTDRRKGKLADGHDSSHCTEILLYWVGLIAKGRNSTSKRSRQKCQD
jgi:hypothetical protein